MERHFLACTYCALVGTTIAVVAAMPGSAEAAGWGLHGRFANTAGTLSEGATDDIDVSMQSFGIGFMLDTAVARDRLFNWRLSVAFEYSLIGWSQGYSFGQPGGSVHNTFAFGVARSDDLRLYLGPSVRFHFGGTVFRPEGADADVSHLLFDAGVGPELGGNIHFDGVSLSLSVAYYVQITQNFVDDPNRPFFGGTSYNYVGVTHVFALTVAALFRGSADEPDRP